MADRLRSKPAKRRRDYPVGIPVARPPGWGPRPDRSPVGFVLTAVLLSLLVIVCMGIGFILTQARRPGRTRPEEVVVAQAPVKKAKKAKRPAPVEKKEDEPPPAPAPKEEPPPTKQPAPAPKEESPPPPPPPAKQPPPRSELTYEKHILPIMERACTSCHGARKKRGGLDLRTFAALVRGGDSGAGIVPGKPGDSPLYETIASNRMPPGQRKLSAADKERIREWIAGGAKSEPARR
jgi:hypothetical protein